MLSRSSLDEQKLYGQKLFSKQMLSHSSGSKAGAVTLVWQQTVKLTHSVLRQVGSKHLAKKHVGCICLSRRRSSTHVQMQTPHARLHQCRKHIWPRDIGAHHLHTGQPASQVAACHKQHAAHRAFLNCSRCMDLRCQKRTSPPRTNSSSIKFCRPCRL